MMKKRKFNCLECDKEVYNVIMQGEHIIAEIRSGVFRTDTCFIPHSCELEDVVKPIKK